LTETKRRWLVDTDKVPRPAEAGDGEDDGEADDGEADGEDPAVAVELGGPGDREESGVVALPWADTDGACPVPLLPDGPPRPDDAFPALTDAPRAEPPAAPPEGRP